MTKNYHRYANGTELKLRSSLGGNKPSPFQVGLDAALISTDKLIQLDKYQKRIA